MKQTDKILEAAHKLCNGNKKAIANAERCGCFYCRRIFQPGLVKAFVGRRPRALCPYCQIDSVIPETKQFPLSEAFLRKMHLYWFST